MTARYITLRLIAQGLGSAGHGVRHWWAQRLSAIALVPLLPWFVGVMASGTTADHAALTAWLRVPVNTILMVLLLIAAFYHAALGLQIVAEDYIHSRARFAVVALVQLACAAGCAAGIVATLLMAITR